MENASKALIIAGAILISILLITLGIVIYNMASSAVENNGMNEVEMQQFNQKFQQFEGKKNGSQVKTLVQTVNTNNANEQNYDTRIVTIDCSSCNGAGKVDKGGDGKASGKIDTTKIQANKNYNITVEDTDGNGLIDKVEVKPA